MEREDALLAQFGQDYCLPIFNAKLYDREAGEEEGRREFVVVLLASNFVVVDSIDKPRPDNGLPPLSLGREETSRYERERDDGRRRGRYKTASTEKASQADTARTRPFCATG